MMCSSNKSGQGCASTNNQIGFTLSASKSGYYDQYVNLATPTNNIDIKLINAFWQYDFFIDKEEIYILSSDVKWKRN